MWQHTYAYGVKCKVKQKLIINQQPRGHRFGMLVDATLRPIPPNHTLHRPVQPPNELVRPK